MSITNSRLKRQIDVNVFMTPIAHTNWNTNTINVNSLHNGHRTSSGAQNDAVYYDVVLAAGTWTVELLYLKDPDAGIYSVRIDTVEKGTVDAYDASTTYNNRSTVTGIVIGTAGKYRLGLVMASKNASSSSYVGRIQHIQLRRA